MCRFVVFKGRHPIRVCDLITRPMHSIIKQSYDSRLRVDDARPLNGDGFGVGWYDPDDDDDTRLSHSNSNSNLSLAQLHKREHVPCVFTSVMPAWNNPNLSRLADKIHSRLVFAHVRAASSDTPVSETNCHPWQHGNFLWMHNGFISGFTKIKRRLRESLTDELYQMISGNTDSESVFAVFLNQLQKPYDAVFTLDELCAAMLKTIATLNEWLRDAGVTEASLMNFAVANGTYVIVTRYNNVNPAQAASLFFSSGSKFESYKPGYYRMVKEKRREDVVIIASEPTTFDELDWLPVPANTMMCITPTQNVLFYPID